MDLSPFSYINPCGYQGLKVTQLVDQGVRINTFELALPVVHSIIQALDMPLLHKHYVIYFYVRSALYG
jgi:lipoyl(octanoyl) transferase